MKRKEVEYHHLPGSRQADSSRRLLALIVSRHAARARYPSPPPSRYPSCCCLSHFSQACCLPSWVCPTTGKWGNKLPTARRDFFGDLGPDRVCVSHADSRRWNSLEIYVGVDRQGNPAWILRIVCLHLPVSKNLTTFSTLSFFFR